MNRRLAAPASKFVYPPPLVLWGGVALCLLLIFGDTKGCGGGPPPYPVPTTLPVAVAVGVDGTPVGLMNLTKEYPGVLADIQAWVKAKGGEYREIDLTQETPPGMDEDWLQAAWKAMDKTKLPDGSIAPRFIGATPHKGVPDQPLPKTPEEANKLLSQLIP